MRYIIKIAFSVVLLSIFAIGQGSAEVWVEPFEDEELNGWESPVEHWRAWWEAIEGMLFARIQRSNHRPICEKNIADFLHWKAVQFQFEQLTMVGKEMIYQQEGHKGMGELCLFLGKQQIAPDFAVEGYIVSPEETSKMTFSETDAYNRGKTKAWYGDKFPFTTDHLKVVFDSGKFQVFTNEVLLTEFTDDDFTKIDVVGLVITCHFGGDWFGARMSSFSISNVDIPNHGLAVQLRGTQLATTWGNLKQFE